MVMVGRDKSDSEEILAVDRSSKKRKPKKGKTPDIGDCPNYSGTRAALS